MQEIIIITGTPGVGKTVLARQLSKKIGSEYLNIGELVKKDRLYQKYDRASRAYIIDESRLRKRLAALLVKDRKIVVETHWVGKFMPKRPGMKAVVVRLDPGILAGRLRSRKWPRRKIWENVEAELIDLSLYESVKFLGRRRVYQIDATRKSPASILLAAVQLLKKGDGWNKSAPNWLERYDPIELSRKIL